jgi:hypothetical protein
MKNFSTLTILALSSILCFAITKMDFNPYWWQNKSQEPSKISMHGDGQEHKNLNSSSMMGCPTDIEIDLSSGQCSALVNYDFEFVTGTPSLVFINPNSNTTVINSTIYCNQGPTTYSRMMTYAGNTDLDVTEVNIGVFESRNSPSVRINIYDEDGVLLGYKVAIAPTLNRQIWKVDMTGANIVIPANSQFKLEIVTNIPIISIFKIGRNTFANNSGFTEAQISSVCTPLNINTEVETGTIGTPMSIVFGLTGRPQDIKVVNVSAGAGSGLESGSEFPIGQTDMVYNIFFGDGSPMMTCAFSVTVNAFDDVATSLACHDLVHVSLQEGCSTVVTADMILQGDNYGCFDDYEVVISLPNGVVIGNTVTEQHLGRKLKTQIIGPNGNICWGEIIVEDKNPPILECSDFYTTCSNDLTPGTNMNPRLPISASITNKFINDGGFRNVNIDIANIQGAEVQDLDVTVHVKHPRLSDLSATITGPNGVTVPLFMAPTCTGNIFKGTANDEALNNTNNPACEVGTNNAVGEFRPLINLSIFDGLPLEGLWVVRVYDNVAGEEGTIEGVDLIFTQGGGQIPFPTTEDIEYDFADPGNPTIFQVYGIDECGAVELSYFDVVRPQPCSSPYSEIIERCWKAVDESGNISDTCCQKIYVYRNGLSTLIFPPNYDGTPGNQPSLSCDLWGDEIPGVDITGYPDGDICSNVQIAEPEDVIVPICPKSYKILRTHKVIEWCNGTVLTHIQIIKVEDNTGPSIRCSRDTIVNTTANTCTARYNAPLPKIISECSGIAKSELSYAPGYTSTTINDTLFTKIGVTQSTRLIDPLPLGTSVVQWTLTDSCGNTTRCRYLVTVQDKALPNVVCDQFTKASITGDEDGLAIIEAITFDDGSNDNCGILNYEVRRMEPGPCFLPTSFGPSARFCCEEIGQNIMVMLKVTDVNGNSNTCMVRVKVEDKLPPYITECPPDITLQCQDDYNDLSITGEPIAIDNCEVISIKKQDSIVINQCGVGYVKRTWTVEDRQGLRNSCVQLITLEDERPFFVFPDNISAPDRPGDDVIWPDNYTTPTCFSSLHPDNLPIQNARPRVSDDNCSLVGMSYKDTQFDFVEGACIKVIREWTVIDWCTFDENDPEGTEGIYHYTQILKVENKKKPTFDAACEDIIIPSYGMCRDSVNIIKTATDDCPEANIDLRWKYELFRKDELFPFETKNTNRIKTVLADGEYRVRWTVEDKCGNVEVCSHKLTVEDKKKPTPICYSDLAVAVMNPDGSVEIWAEDYDKGSFDNCTPTRDLYLTFFNAKPLKQVINSVHYFIGDGILRTEAQYLAGEAQKWDPSKRSSSMIFTCDDIPNGVSEEVLLEVSVMDSLGNQDYCTITLLLQDNANVCPDNSNFTSVSGRIVTPSGGSLANVDVVIKSDNGEYSKITKSNTTGKYEFLSVVPGQKYNVSAVSNQDILNGVSTLDLVHIQRHILGLATLDQPTKIIAADVDNNEKVTASDLVALRKVILGINSNFPNNQHSYRFVTADHTFSDPQVPFPFKERYTYNPLTTPKSNQNLTPIKIGDVNGSAIYGLQTDVVESRSNQSMEIYSNVTSISSGQYARIPVFASSKSEIIGLQGTIKIDPSIATIQHIELVHPDVSNDNISNHAADLGHVTFSVQNENGWKMDGKTPLFYIYVKTLKDVTEEILEVNSDITPALAYDMDNRRVKIQSRDASYDTMILHQNSPNPFTTETVIRFELPKATDATLRIVDVNGHILRSWTDKYAAGIHEVKINSEDINVSGIVSYQLISDDQMLTKKMILLESK